eukprot:1154574-Pelagomonas_calceolata.AAC.2
MKSGCKKSVQRSSSQHSTAPQPRLCKCSSVAQARLQAALLKGLCWLRFPEGGKQTPKHLVHIRCCCPKLPRAAKTAHQ